MVFCLFCNGLAVSIKRCSTFSLTFSLELFNLWRFEQLWQSLTSFIIHNFKYTPHWLWNLSKRHSRPSTKTKTCSLPRESGNISIFQRYILWFIILLLSNPGVHWMDIIQSLQSGCIEQVIKGSMLGIWQCGWDNKRQLPNLGHTLIMSEPLTLVMVWCWQNPWWSRQWDGRNGTHNPITPITSYSFCCHQTALPSHRLQHSHYKIQSHQFYSGSCYIHSLPYSSSCSSYSSQPCGSLQHLQVSHNPLTFKHSSWISKICGSSLCNTFSSGKRHIQGSTITLWYCAGAWSRH